MPGPLFAVTLKKAAKSKSAGALIAVGHGIVEFPLMFLIFFVLSQFDIPTIVQIVVGLVGGLSDDFYGCSSFPQQAQTGGGNGEFEAGFRACGSMDYSCQRRFYSLVVNHRDYTYFEC